MVGSGRIRSPLRKSAQNALCPPRRREPAAPPHPALHAYDIPRPRRAASDQPIRVQPARVFISEPHFFVTGETGTELRASDATLIARLVERDESALAALYDRYAGMLSSVLNRILRDTQAAEEILQDIFYQLWRTAAQFDPARGSLPGWLLVIARNRAISRLRRHNPASGEELLENTVVLPTNLESTIAQQQLMAQVKRALGNLPKEQRAAIELAYFEGLTHSEIAARTGDPLGTVKTRLRSALETLKRNFKP